MVVLIVSTAIVDLFSRYSQLTSIHLSATWGD